MCIPRSKQYVLVFAQMVVMLGGSFESGRNKWQHAAVFITNIMCTVTALDHILLNKQH